MTHAESIELFKKLGVKMTPELKYPSVKMPFDGDYSQEKYAQQMIDEYKKVGKQAVFLDDRYETLEGFDFRKPDTWKPSMEELFDRNVRIIAPPMWMLPDLDESGKMVPSVYAKQA